MEEHRHLGRLRGGMLKMSPFTNMPDDVSALGSATVADITSGRNKVFVGPIKDQTVQSKCRPARSWTTSRCNSMQWLVEGVDGKLS